jgi:hypothetical protein
VGASRDLKTLDLLIRYAITTWESLGESILNRLIDTMMYRVNAVLEAKGWYTKY